MVGQHHGSQEEKWKMVGLCRLHGPKQSMPKRPVPHASYRLAGGCDSGPSSNEFLRCLSGLSSNTISSRGSREDSLRDTYWNYHYKVMSFGLKNARSIYQRMMTRMFESQLGKSIEIYVDDMVVKSKVVSEHLRDLGSTFNVLGSTSCA